MSNGDHQTLADLQRQVATLQKRLDDAQKMASLGELLGTTTHEFNNILTTVINYAKIGLRQRDHEVRDNALSKILNAGQRAAKISGVVLGLSRRRSDVFESVSLAQLVDDTLVLLERELNKHRVRVEKYYQDVPPVMANTSQVQRVLLNLMVNARQAMPRGGQLLVKIQRDEAAGTVDLTLRDTGCGIDQEMLPHIFEPYFTTKSGPDESGKGGTGLGLALCRDIIEAHHGRIRVESAVGKGTSFTIKLPPAGGQPAAAAG